jgi:hypothetical protein
MLEDHEWDSIREFVTKLTKEIAGRRSDPVIISRVTKNDLNNRLVWIKELEDVPIPLYGFEYEVKYYDETPKNTGWGWGDYFTDVKIATARLKVPKVGELVIVVREMGSNRMPRCLGALNSTNFAIDEGE